jgi:formate dehydrogenase gamma subunit
MSDQNKILRFHIPERIEHAVLIVSFTTLAITGLIQKFSQVAFSNWLISVLGGIETTRIIHHIAAVLITLEAVYHLLILFYKLFVRRVRPSMLPGIKDILDALRAFGFNLGIVKEHPKMGRYNFTEKAEYWAMLWGTVIMGLTGYMLWNPISTAKILPGVVLPAAKAAHGAEAILAVLAILVWHFYGVHLKKLNMSMLNGKLSREEMEAEHALELEEIDHPVEKPVVAANVMRKRRMIFWPITAVFALVSLFLVYKIVTGEKTALAVVPQGEVVPVFSQQTPTPIPTSQVAGGVGMDPVIAKNWTASGHANAESPAFTHWNSEIPPEIPVACARCHSSTGFLDYIGADGTTAFQVDKAAPVGTVISCNTCHNDTTRTLATVKFPSGAEITGLGREAICMTCHQGTASKVQVDEAINNAGLTDEDSVAAQGKEMGFVNIHYYAAAVSRYGTQVKGGYEYPDKTYDGLFTHVEGNQTCIDCHDPHTLQVKVDQCQACHTGVTQVEDLRNIRMIGSSADYNGNGDVTEGLFDEIDGLRMLLTQAIQTYAKEVTQAPIIYDLATYPYFFKDTNADGKADKDELAFANRYTAWTARLAKAAYNLQTAVKDPGSYAHGGKYIIELLYDSIVNLNEKISTPVDLSKAQRNSTGHFDSSAAAFRHWDADGKVPVGCVKCHTASGLPQLVKVGVNTELAVSNSLECATCHDDLAKFTRLPVQTVAFPSGAKAGFAQKPDSNLCVSCHQGLASSVSVDKAVAGLDADTVSDKLSFINAHYFTAGATMFGTQVKGMAEYAGKTYQGLFTHTEAKSTCTDCHDAHTLQVSTADCKQCHGLTDPTEIRWTMTSNKDYNGNGGTREGISAEVSGLNEALYSALQAYAVEVSKVGIVYSAEAYPYFFKDTNNNSKADADETVFANAYKAWTPRLLKAAYNYHYVVKDPGAYVHNAKYVLQVLYDSLEDLSTRVTSLDITKMNRP